MKNITLLQNNQFSLIKQLFLKLTDEKRAKFIYFVNSMKEQGLDLLDVFNAQGISRFLQSQKYNTGRPDVCPFCMVIMSSRMAQRKGLSAICAVAAAKASVTPKIPF